MSGGPKLQRVAIATLGFLLPMVASHLARGALGKGYERVAKRKPPKNPAAKDVPWKEAFAWAFMAGVIGSFAKLYMRRVLAPTPLPVEQDDRDLLESDE